MTWRHVLKLDACDACGAGVRGVPWRKAFTLGTLIDWMCCWLELVCRRDALLLCVVRSLLILERPLSSLSSRLVAQRNAAVWTELSRAIVGR